MLCRIASRHASQHGPESVAIISFSDNRIGAWTQLQMLASRLGVDCFRVGGADLLSPMLGELGTPSIPSLLPIPEVHKVLDEDGILLQPWLERSAGRFLDELTWYAEALREKRKGGVPY